MMRLLLVASFLSTAIAIKYKVVSEWKYVDFVWESPQQKQEAIDSGNYNETSIILYDVDKAKDGRMFVTSVRDEGVPASLMTVTDKMGKGGPLLRPYPDWSWYKNNKNKTDCKNIIISVYRVFITCNHIFVLDCGKIGDQKVCPARLLIFDLSRNSLVKRVIIPDDVATNKNGTGLLVTPVVYSRNCKKIAENAIVYMADTEGDGLVTWDAHEPEKFHRTESIYMKPTDTMFTIEGKSFFLNDGILGVTLIGKDLYYAPLAGTNIYKINRSLLQDSLNSSVINNLTVHAGILQGQTGPIASKKCAIFFSNMPQTSILCADSSKPIDFDNMEVVLNSEEDLQFPSGLKAKTKNSFHRRFSFEEGRTTSDYLLVMSNKYQDTAFGDFDTNVTNFRIIWIDIDDIKRETNCFDSCSDDGIILYDDFESFDMSWDIDIQW